MLSISQLMVRLWVAEESRLGVSRPNGVLQNLWQPLQSHDRGSGRQCRNAGTTRRPISRPESAVSPAVDTSNSNHDSVSDPLVYGSGPDAGGVENISKVADDTLNGAPPDGNGDSEDIDGYIGKTAGKSITKAIAPALKLGKQAAARGSGGRVVAKRAASKVDSETSVAKAMRNLDLRAKIAAVLGMVGFDVSATDSGLGPSELKASYMATNYLDFRAGEAWQEVSDKENDHCAQSVDACQLIMLMIINRLSER